MKTSVFCSISTRETPQKHDFWCILASIILKIFSPAAGCLSHQAYYNNSLSEQYPYILFLRLVVARSYTRKTSGTAPMQLENSVLRMIEARSYPRENIGEMGTAPMLLINIFCEW